MKKFTKLISLLCLAAAFVLASCSSPSSGGNSGGSRVQVSGKIGKYGAPYEVGDIVFRDGSATPYEDFLGADGIAGNADDTITDTEKAAAIAVIFYDGTGLNSDVNGTSNNTTDRTLGVGLRHSNTYLTWCNTTANGFWTKITTIQCTKTSGDKNGSDNYEQMAAVSGIDDTGDLDNYPAFQFGKEYSTAATEGTDYDKSGWYLPSLAELNAIYNVKATVNAASNLCDGSQFGARCYWSSSQSDSLDPYANFLNFADGGCGHNSKASVDDYYVCAVRAFN